MDVDATEVQDGRPLARRPDGATSVAIALLLAGFAAAAAGATRNKSPLAPGERLLYRTRPRKSLLHYVFSLGTWELVRRSTEFNVTPRRVIVQRGVLRKHVRSIPLRSIGAVDVSAGPFSSGVVRISEHGDARTFAEFGPLSGRSARQFASALTDVLARS